MNFIELIERKRDGEALAAIEIAWLIDEYTASRVPDYQMSAMLMAVFKEGLREDELAAWTEAMLHSGEILDFSDIAAPKVDKHSTGGVGDKVSIPLAPMVAACGIAVPMISGRGLGHTGGTLDKLESIPGFRTALDPVEFRQLVERHGLVLAGASETIAPADRLIYALRDATGTVPSNPLIASSIMSKKLAEGIDALVLDVKVGRGAFKRDLEGARSLAKTMVDIGTAHGTATVALLTDMSQPLGREIGNASEIAESVAVLRGGGPDDLVELTYTLGAEMLVMGGVATDTPIARAMLEEVIASGAAFDKFVEVVIAQGGDPAVINDPDRLPAARHETVVIADRDGVITRCDALDLGVAAMRLGAGRATKEDVIDQSAGITVEAKVGDAVERGDALARLHWNDESRLAEATELANGAFQIGEGPAIPPSLVLGEVR
ncbi:MAG: thymidine phosphorylase [Actinobacteria bacterium RBG_16_68_21]|nr:MAG: thymidine phosphorylase [Actinobacteria bacterium RBG_16_68_21]